MRVIPIPHPVFTPQKTESLEGRLLGTYTAILSLHTIKGSHWSPKEHHFFGISGDEEKGAHVPQDVFLKKRTSS